MVSVWTKSTIYNSWLIVQPIFSYDVPPGFNNEKTRNIPNSEAIPPGFSNEQIRNIPNSKAIPPGFNNEQTGNIPNSKAVPPGSNNEHTRNILNSKAAGNLNSLLESKTGDALGW